jgi:nucleoside-diphosphate-sugar epimerase
VRVLLLGGTGALGRILGPKLHAAGCEVHLAGRSGEVPVDLRSGAGLAEAVGRADTIVHLASDARRPREVDVAGTKLLLATIDSQHLIYLSIVGVDVHPFP